MPKRQKWNQSEDKALKKIIAGLEEFKKDIIIKWDYVSLHLNLLSFQKSAKQCRERCFKKLDPTADPKPVTRKMDRKREQRIIAALQTQKKPLERNFK